MTAQAKSAGPPAGGGSVGLLLLVSPDEYLLEMKRERIVAEWEAAHPGGEVVRLDPAPAPERLVREVVNPSLFAPERLVLVPDAQAYFPKSQRTKEAQRDEDEDGDDDEPPQARPVAEAGEHRGDVLARHLEGLTLRDVALVLALVAKQPPKGALADALAAAGEVRFLPVPEAPKPWELTRVSREQRAVLHEVIAQVAPRAAADPEVVDALCEAYGFKVREMAQAAARLATAGEVTADAVRLQAGVGDGSVQHLENALVERDRRAVAHLLGVLAAGGVLLDWRGEPVAPGGVGPVLSAALGRLLRQALAMRGHARRCGLERELDARKCAERFWYSNVYWSSKSKTGIHAQLAADIIAAGDSPLGDAKPWPCHRAFRLAAAYGERELVAALTALARSGAERARAPEAVAALTPVLLALTAPRGAAARTAPAARPAPRQRSAPARRA
jgi:hypothetical protein